MVIVTVLLVLGAAAGWLGASLRPAQYTSIAILEWDPSVLRYADVNAYVPDSQSLVVQVQAQADRLDSDSVIDPAASSLKIDAQELRDHLVVSLGTSPTQILVSGRSTDPSSARALTAAVVSAYSSDVTKTFGNAFSTQADALQPAVDALTSQLAALPATSPLATPLATQLASTRAQQIVLRARADAVVSPLSITRSAPRPLVPSSPSPRTLAVVGGALGVVIGLGIVFVTRLRRRPEAAPTHTPTHAGPSSRRVAEPV